MEILGAFMIGLVSALVGSVCTGANLISVPGLIFLGLSPVSSIATTRLSAVTGGLTTVYEYNQAGKVMWRYTPAFVAIAIVAGLVGPRILLSLHPDVVGPVVGVMLLLMLPILILEPNFGRRRHRMRTSSRVAGLCLLFVVMVYGTSLGVGGGIFTLYTLVQFFGFNLKQANATGNVVWMAGAGTALAYYIANGAVSWLFGIPLLFGAALGGYLGAKFALRSDVRWVKYLLAAVIMASAVKLIWFSA